MAQDSTKKFSYFKNDSVLFKKFNVTLDGGFQMPKVENYPYHVNEMPMDEGLDDYSFYKPGVVNYMRRRTFDANVSVNFKLIKKLYVALGLKWCTYNNSIRVESDSLFYKKQFELYSVRTENNGYLINLPLLFQYRINKYFYPFVGYSVNMMAKTNRTVQDSEREFPMYASGGAFMSKHNEKIAGFDFNIPKARRLYFSFKFVHTGKKWTVKDKDLWYSFGLKYYII